MSGGAHWRRGRAASLPPEPRGQMGREGRFNANACGERDVLGKRMVRESPAQAARRGLRPAVPEAGGDGRAARRTVGEEGPREEGQGWQPLAGFRRVDERAGGAKHLFGGQGQLFDGESDRDRGQPASGR